MRRLQNDPNDPTQGKILGILAFLVTLAMVTLLARALAADTHEEQYTETVPLVDELPQSDMAAFVRAEMERNRLIGRLADGIYKTRTVKGTVPFWFCGEAHEGEDARDLAILVAWHIVTTAAMAETEVRPINVWELAGLASTESGFDLCTLGLYSRKMAYKLKIIKKRRRTVSHTREEVERAISHPKMRARFRAYDLGMIQVLDIYYHAEPKDLLSWQGFRWQVEYFHGLGVRYNTPTPSLYWRGHKAQWKLDKVRRYARALGARADEI